MIIAWRGVIFFACGLFYYFKIEQVKVLFTAMCKKFQGCCLVFDTAGKVALKIMIKSVVKDMAEIENVDAYFHAENPKKDISSWLTDAKISSKGYMLGYNDLHVASVPKFYRFLAKIGDNLLKMKIIKIEF